MKIFGNTHAIFNFFQMNILFEKFLSKYFWEAGKLPDDSNNTEYISFAMSLSKTVTLMFLLGDGPVRHNLFQNLFRYHFVFVSKLV